LSKFQIVINKALSSLPKKVQIKWIETDEVTEKQFYQTIEDNKRYCNDNNLIFGYRVGAGRWLWPENSKEPQDYENIEFVTINKINYMLSKWRNGYEPTKIFKCVEEEVATGKIIGNWYDY
jgi:hypothetical protein